MFTKWSFRVLMDETIKGLDAAEDRWVIRQAVALDGLNFEFLEFGQARRVADAMESGAMAAREYLLTQPHGDDRDLEAADKMATVSLLMQDVRERPS